MEEALEAIKPKLKGAELLVMNINEGGIGKNSVKSLREQLEMMEVRGCGHILMGVAFILIVIILICVVIILIVIIIEFGI